MLDLSRISETIAGLLGSAPAAHEIPQAALAEVMERAGIDPSLADGLSPDEIVGLLESRGFDLSQLHGHPLGEAIANSGLGEHISNFLGGPRSKAE